MNPSNFPPDHDDGNLSADLKSFEARLKNLLPRDDRLHRDRLIFLAGRASLESDHERVSLARSARRRNAWSAILASLATAAVLLLAFFLSQPKSETGSATRAETNTTTHPNQALIHSDETIGVPLGAIPPQLPPDVDSRSLGGRSPSITTRDVCLFNGTDLASGNLPSKPFIDSEQGATREQRRIFTPSDWHWVVEDL